MDGRRSYGFYSDWIEQRLRAGGYWLLRSRSDPSFHLQGRVEAADLAMIHQAMRVTLKAYRLDGHPVPKGVIAELRKYRPPKGWVDYVDLTSYESPRAHPPPLPLPWTAISSYEDAIEREEA